jgi:outer membrane lipoprotein carrier protein
MKPLILIALIFMIPSVAFCQEAKDASAPATGKAEIFSRIQQAASSVKTLSGEFTQEKNLEILENAPASRGRFFYQNPDRLRWEVYEPASMGFIVNGDKGKRWKGQSGSRQSFDLKKEPVLRIISGQVFAWARADFKQLEAGYDITVLEDAPVILKLIPLSATEKKYLDYIKLIFSLTEDYVSAIEIHETGGDYTRINFIDMAVNKPLQEDIF